MKWDYYELQITAKLSSNWKKIIYDLIAHKRILLKADNRQKCSILSINAQYWAFFTERPKKGILFKVFVYSDGKVLKKET